MSVLRAILRHAFQNMSVDELPVTTFELSSYEAKQEPSESFKQAIENGIKFVYFFDEMIQALK